MDDEVEISPDPLDLAKRGVEARRVGDVAMAYDLAAKFERKRTDPFLQRFALKGEGEFRARLDAPPWRCPRRSTDYWRAQSPGRACRRGF